MFVPRPCSTPHCAHSALTGLEQCSEHCEDIDAFVSHIVEILTSEKKLVDYDISGIALRGLEVEGVRMTGCNISRVRLEKVSFKKASIHLVFMDGSVITDCDFSSGVIHNSVFAGSSIIGSRFQDSDIIQCNFMGARIHGSVFNHSNLYATRFSAARFADVSMKDCNLIRVHFDKAVVGIDFKSSNTNEAVFGEAYR